MNNILPLHPWRLPQEYDPKVIRDLKHWYSIYNDLEDPNHRMPVEAIRELLDWWGDISQAITRIQEECEYAIHRDSAGDDLTCALADLLQFYNPYGENNDNGK